MKQRGNTTEFDAGRRQILRAAVGSAAFGGSSVLAAMAQGASEKPLVPELMLTQGQPILSPPYGVPSKFEKDVIRRPTEIDPNHPFVLEFHAAARPPWYYHAERTVL